MLPPTNNPAFDDPRVAEPFMLVSPSILIALLNRSLRLEVDNLTTLFDPTLEYVEVMRGRNALRSSEAFARPGHNTMLDVSEPLPFTGVAPNLGDSPQSVDRPNFPIFAFNRTALTPLDVHNFRGAEWHAANPVPNNRSAILDVNFFNASFDLNFRYYAADSAALEAFEVFYSTGTIFKHLRKIPVNLAFLENYLPPTVLSNWFFNCEWYPLTDIQFNVNPGYFSISGMVKITSGFMAAKVRRGFLVEIINLYLENELDPTIDFRLQKPWITARISNPTV